MRINKSMSLLLKDINIREISPIKHYPIWQKKDKNGRPYWGVGHFCSFDPHGNLEEQDLSQLEWDGNEVYKETEKQEELPLILMETIGIMKAWKETLEKDYSDVSFYIFASFDNGDELVNREEFEFWASTTLRFWAPRNRNTVINLDNFDDWKQPAILIECNFPTV